MQPRKKRFLALQKLCGASIVQKFLAADLVKSTVNPDHGHACFCSFLSSNANPMVALLWDPKRRAIVAVGAQGRRPYEIKMQASRCATHAPCHDSSVIGN